MTDKTEAPELMPCPFLGSTPTVDVWTPQDGEHRDYGRGAWIVTIKSELVAIVGSSGVSQQDAYNKAVNRWNTRTDAICAEVTAETREHVIDQIEQTISDAHDVDTTDRNYAEAVFENCFEWISKSIRPELKHAHQEGYDAGKADVTGKLPWRMKDLERGLILFRTSNNAHDFTNYSAKSAKIDKLPQAARDELAAIMTNMAIGYSREDVKQNGEIQQWIEEAHKAAHAAGRAEALKEAVKAASEVFYPGHPTFNSGAAEVQKKLRALINKEARE